MSKPNKIQISQEFKERLENIYGKSSKSTTTEFQHNDVNNVVNNVVNNLPPPPPPPPPPLPPPTSASHPATSASTSTSVGSGEVSNLKGVYIVEKSTFDDMVMSHTRAAVKELLPKYIEDTFKSVPNLDTGFGTGQAPELSAPSITRIKNVHQRGLHNIDRHKKRRKIHVERNGKSTSVIHPRYTDKITDTSFMQL